MAEWEWDSKHNLTCCACGCKNVESRVTFDHFCFGGRTVEYRCMSCKAEWFDDTIIGTDNQEQSCIPDKH